jgi:hypothetical protein|tara:strand:+ start:677 stop:883 length:207 start_codon:yes stop_codon:yes gene_type:complete
MAKKKKALIIKKSQYQDIADCIQTDQVPAAAIAEYFADKKFFAWFKKKYRVSEEVHHDDHYYKVGGSI